MALRPHKVRGGKGNASVGISRVSSSIRNPFHIESSPPAAPLACAAGSTVVNDVGAVVSERVCCRPLSVGPSVGSSSAGGRADGRDAEEDTTEAPEVMEECHSSALFSGTVLQEDATGRIH